MMVRFGSSTTTITNLFGSLATFELFLKKTYVHYLCDDQIHLLVLAFSFSLLEASFQVGVILAFRGLYGYAA
jgi:hypothetical protein